MSDDLNKPTFKGIRVMDLNDQSLASSQEEKIKYIETRDESVLKFAEGIEPTWYYFKPLTYKEVIEFMEDGTKSVNLKAIEVFSRTFVGVSRGNGPIKSVEKLQEENPDFSGPDGMANLIVATIGFDSLVTIGHMAFNMNSLGKKNKPSLV